jgi:hypothetical protein
VGVILNVGVGTLDSLVTDSAEGAKIASDGPSYYMRLLLSLLPGDARFENNWLLVTCVTRTPRS